MLVVSVKFQTVLSYDEVVSVMNERLPQFQALKGLTQKYYGHEQATDAYTGIYVWESEEAFSEYRQSELAATIAEAYQVTDTPRIEVFELITTLRPVEMAAAVS